MEIAKLVLEYLQLAFSWPVVFGALAVYLLKQHGQGVAAALQRLNSVSLPGGVKLDMPYPANAGEIVPVSPSTPSSLPQEETSVEALGKDFDSFLWQGIIRHRILVGIEIDRLWNGMKGTAFFLAIPPKAETQSEKLQLIKNTYRISEKACSDFVFLEGLKKGASRKELLEGYHKSSILQGYLSNKQ